MIFYYLTFNNREKDKGCLRGAKPLFRNTIPLPLYLGGRGKRG
jgi:hypothetical protein